jgi:FlaA1/EpsC-like NDP-sugar epimerase
MRIWVGKALLYLASWALAFALALAWTGARPHHWLITFSLFFVAKVCTMTAFGNFRELWSHTSLEDLVALAAGALFSSTVLALVLGLFPPLGTVALAMADGAITLALVGPARVAPRIYYEVVRPLFSKRPRAVVLAGRPERVELELRRLRRQESARERVAGLVLDGPPLEGSLLHRLEVFGFKDLEAMLERRQLHEVLLVPPTTPLFNEALQRLCALHGVGCRSAASLLALTELLTSAEQLLDRTVQSVEELVRRAVKDEIGGRCVMVTGAGGSIGRELAVQLLQFQPARLVLVNRGENGLFHTERALAAVGGAHCRIDSHVLDVRCEDAVDRLFHGVRPHLVFHAAAHKHVPMMERHPAEAVLNNVGGLRAVADAAHRHGIGCFVFVSTDKAVHPTSVMGATKRIGELYVRAMSLSSGTRFVSVRFGNVLGSNGSVLPIFVEQVQRGGPVTVTHAEMSRYFMSIPEACKLVLSAAARGRGGELFVLDMGQPMRIVDLAERVIERAGLRPGEDVPIVFSAPRPGDKISEQLMFDSELPTATATDGVWQVEVEAPPLERLRASLQELLEVARTGDDQAVRRGLAAELADFRAAQRDQEGEPTSPPQAVSALVGA